MREDDKESAEHRFDPAIAHRLTSLAIQAYYYDAFGPWASANGYVHAQAFHEGSIQAKLLDDGKQCLLVFAGTDMFNLAEWFRYDFDLRHQPLLGGWVHRGFWNALHARDAGSKTDLFAQIVRALGARFAVTGRRKVLVGGHSLGAALAKLFAAEIAQAAEPGDAPVKPADLILYTTGEPRSGSLTYAAAIERHYAGRMHRGIFGRDWVPQVPLPKLGYRHSGLPHFIERDGTILPEVERIHYRTSGADHLPQRYARAYENALRKMEEKTPKLIARNFKQTLRDFYEVAFHPSRN